MHCQIVLVRHGETAWSRQGRHTGRTDIPLTDIGLHEAASIRPTLASWTFAHQFSSPLGRAYDTAIASGIAGEIRPLDDLVEWDYGIYEGRTTADITAEEPGWSKWEDPIPSGEDVSEVAKRADRAIDVLMGAASDGAVIAYAHGHLLAILIARWLDLEPSAGRRFVLDTATVSVLGTKRGDRVLRLLNHRCGSAEVAKR